MRLGGLLKYAPLNTPLGTNRSDSTIRKSVKGKKRNTVVKPIHSSRFAFEIQKYRFKTNIRYLYRSQYSNPKNWILMRRPYLAHRLAAVLLSIDTRETREALHNYYTTAYYVRTEIHTRARPFGSICRVSRT